MKSKIMILVLTVMTISACRKEKANVIPAPTIGDVNIQLKYSVDGKSLVFDTLMYTNAAGNLYSVSKVRYYLSRFRFYNAGTVKFSSDTIIYADAIIPQQVTFKNIPAGTYDSVSYHIGLDEAQNISNSLPATLENINMAWPDMMGGGYHFLQLEGHWKDSTGNLGYAMHIGKNGFLVKAGTKKTVQVQGGKTLKLALTMNINEWFANPHMYDLDKDGVYSMGNAILMKKLSENGRDVFDISVL